MSNAEARGENKLDKSQEKTEGECGGWGEAKGEVRNVSKGQVLWEDLPYFAV